MKKFFFTSIFFLAICLFSCDTPSYHEIAIQSTKHGTVKVFNESKLYRDGQRIILDIKPDDGYELAVLYYTTSDGSVKVKIGDTNSFWMPNFSISIIAIFEPQT